MAEQEHKQDIIQTCIDCILSPTAAMQDVFEAIDRISKTLCTRPYRSSEASERQLEEWDAAADRLAQPGVLVKLISIILESVDGRVNHHAVRDVIRIAFHDYDYRHPVVASLQSQLNVCIEKTLRTMRCCKEDEPSCGLLRALNVLARTPAQYNVRPRIVCADVFEFVLAHCANLTSPADLELARDKIALLSTVTGLEHTVHRLLHVHPKRQRLFQILDSMLGAYCMDDAIVFSACQLVALLFNRYHPRGWHRPESEEMLQILDGVIAKITNLLLSNNTRLIEHALRGLMSCRNRAQMKLMLDPDHGLLLNLSQAIAHLVGSVPEYPGFVPDAVRKSSTLVAKCITLSDKEQTTFVVERIITNNIVQELLKLIRDAPAAWKQCFAWERWDDHQYWRSAEYAMFAICAMLTVGNDQQVLFLITLGVIPLLCNDKITEKMMESRQYDYCNWLVSIFNKLFLIGHKLRRFNSGMNVTAAMIEKNGGLQLVYGQQAKVSAEQLNCSFYQYLKKQLRSGSDNPDGTQELSNTEERREAHDFGLCKLVVHGFARQYKVPLVVVTLMVMYHFVEFPFNVRYLRLQMDFQKKVLLCCNTTCEQCKRMSDGMICCDGCKSVYYCDKTCQTKDLDSHKSICEDMQNSDQQIQTIIELSMPPVKYWHNHVAWPN